VVSPHGTLGICLLSKYPPIEGGVSTITYRLARGLAQRGHSIHVVTNANEVESAYRIYLRPEDVEHLETSFSSGGYVRLHTTDCFCPDQFHVPVNNPFTTKLASLAASVVTEHGLDCILSIYLEPYGVAGHLAAEMTGVPHVVKTAGSDVGRLWKGGQFGPVYRFVIERAAGIITGRSLVTKAADFGISRRRIFIAPRFCVPLQEFCPTGVQLDPLEFGHAPSDTSLGDAAPNPGGPPLTLGIYGKLSESKGAFSILRAMRILLDRGIPVRLLAMAHGTEDIERHFRSVARENGVDEHVRQIPFLPHWRVPEFLRCCQVACHLEQDFAIRTHVPTTPREIMASGTCLVVSREAALKQPESYRLVHGFNCVIVNPANDPEEIARSVRDIVCNPGSLKTIGDNGREYVVAVQSKMAFCESYERILVRALSLARKPDLPCPQPPHVLEVYSGGVGPLLAVVVANAVEELQRRGHAEPDSVRGSEEWLRSTLAVITEQGDAGHSPSSAVVEALRFACQLLRGMHNPSDSRERELMSLFRFDEGRSLWDPRQVGRYVPEISGDVLIESYELDPMQWIEHRLSGQKLPAEPTRKPTTIVVVPPLKHNQIRWYSFSGGQRQVLEACRGSLSVDAIGYQMAKTNGEGWKPELVSEIILKLFSVGIVRLSLPSSDWNKRRSTD